MAYHRPPTPYHLISHHFANFVAGDGGDDLFAIGLAAGQRLGEVQRLLGLDLAGHGRLEGIDDGLDNRGAGSGESVVEDAADLGRIFHGETGAAAGVGKGGAIYGIEVASVLWIAQKNHLLPLDLPQRVVFDDDHLDGQPIFDGGDKVGHQHGEATVADKGHDLPARKSDLRGDGVGESGGHGGEVAAEGVLLTALDGNVPRPPGGDGAAVAGDDSVGTQALAKFVRHHLRLHGLIGARLVGAHHLAPLFHSVLGLLQEFAIFFVAETWNKLLQGALAVAHQSNFNGITQADALGVKLDLHAASLLGLGHEFDVGERSSDHEQGIAIFDGILRRARAQQADAAGGVGAIVGDTGFAQQRLDDGRGQQIGGALEFVSGMQSTGAGKDGDFLACVQNLRGFIEIGFVGQASAAREDVGRMMGNVALAALLLFDFFFLQIYRDGDVRNAAIGERGAAGEIHDVFHVGGAHDAFVEDRDIHKKLVEGHILLGESADEVVILQSGNGQHRRLVELGVVEAIEQVNAARAGSSQTNAQLAGQLGVSAGAESGGFFVAHLNEANFFLMSAQGFHDAVDAVARQAKDNFYAPVNQGFDQYVGCSHGALLLCVC